MLHTFSLRLNADLSWDQEPQASLDSEGTLIFAFYSTVPFDSDQTNDLGKVQTLLNKVKEAFPQATVVGCTSSGEVLGTDVYDQGLCLAGIQFKTKSFDVLQLTQEQSGAGSDRFQIPANWPQQPPQGVIIIADGHRTVGSDLVRAISAKVGPATPIVGGLAGDGKRLQQTYLSLNDQVMDKGALLISLNHSGVEVVTGLGSGWSIFGPDRIITRSKGNILYSIDDKPALDLYKQYLGEHAAELPASALRFPLEVEIIVNSVPHRVVRTILGIDAENHAMIFAGDMPEGARVRLMHASNDQLIGDATDAVQNTFANEVQHEKAIALVFSCVGRRLVLGTRVEEEISAFGELKFPIPVVGFFTHGEICNLGPAAAPAFHNETFTFGVIREKRR